MIDSFRVRQPLERTFKQVCVEPPSSALNMTLSAFAVEHRRLQHGPAAKQQTRRPPLLLFNDWWRSRDRRTDGHPTVTNTLFCMQAASVMQLSNGKIEYHWISLLLPTLLQALLTPQPRVLQGLRFKFMQLLLLTARPRLTQSSINNVHKNKLTHEWSTHTHTQYKNSHCAQ